MSSLPEFAGLHWISDPVDAQQFPKLRLKYRPNLVSLAGGMSTLPVTQPEARATPLQPDDWARMLREAASPQGPVVLDVRNGYEWDAGHFEGAQRPLEVRGVSNAQCVNGQCVNAQCVNAAHCVQQCRVQCVNALCVYAA